MEHFYVTLPSNSSEAFYGRQNMSNYKTRLPEALKLDVSEWEVGLAEFIYPVTWNNVKDAWFTVKKRNSNEDWMFEKCNVPDSRYTTKQLIATLQQKLEKCLGPEQAERIQFGYSPVTRRTKVFIDHHYAISFSKELATPLGFGDSESYTLRNFNPLGYDSRQMFKGETPLVINSQPCGTHENPTVTLCNLEGMGFFQSPNAVVIDNENIVSPFVADVDRDLRTLYIHTDIVQPQLVGHVHAPLLRTVAVTGGPGDVKCETFNKIHYMSIERSTFQEIEIHITDETGKNIPFEQGRVIVKLHFRRK
jgi:hypothetical protein